ncbi:hypothetical protein BTE77_34855 [Ensifer adhaerens]|nr:hypothetical protein BTE77_34855 [Ensifer adhaerens]
MTEKTAPKTSKPAKRTQLLLTLESDTASRFKARFPARGDRTLYLRRCIDKVISAPANNPQAAQTELKEPGPAEKVAVRLYPEQIAQIEKAAAAHGMKPSQWKRAVLEARLDAATPPLSSADRLALAQAARIVRKIGNNHNQLTKAVKRAAVNGKPLIEPLAVLDELAVALTALRAELDGLLHARRRYWSGKAVGDE